MINICKIFSFFFNTENKNKKSKKKNNFKKFTTELRNFIYYNEKSVNKRIGLGIASENMKPKDMYCFHVVIQLKSFTIVFCHQIRGDLIYVYKENMMQKSSEEILEISYDDSNETDLAYVDQTYAYGSGVGLNDIKSNLSTDDMILLCGELTSYIEQIK